MLSKLFGINELKITPIKKVSKGRNCWGGDAVIFYVKNGRGLIKQKYGDDGNKGLSSLVYDDIPISKIHGDCNFSTTCEKFISAGYGLDKVKDKTIFELERVLNKPFVSLEDSFKNLEPLIELLPDGYYALADLELLPTNGDGEFFWNLGNEPKYNRASAPISDDETWLEVKPKYILPTISPKFFNIDKADSYVKNNEERALAYYLEGYLCALLHGHHKAVAAAMEKRPVKTLVILPTTMILDANESLDSEDGIIIAGETFYEKDLGSGIKKVKDFIEDNKMSKMEVEKYLSLRDDNFGTYSWPKAILNIGEYFPDVFTLACMKWAGDLTNVRLDKIVNKKEICDINTAYYIVKSLYITKNPRFKEVAFFICKNEEYSSIWSDVYLLLAKIKDKDIENFFMDYSINYGNLKPNINKIVNDYLKENLK